MRLRATLEVKDVEVLLAELLPFRVRLDADDDRKFADVMRPRDVRIVANQGIEVTCDATLSWPVPVVGAVRIEVEDVTLLMPISVSNSVEGARIFFGVRLQNMDVRAVPGRIDDALVRRINRELETHRTGFDWGIGETLTLRLDLPNLLVPLDAFRTWFGDLTVNITEAAVELAAPMRLGIERGDAERRVLL